MKLLLSYLTKAYKILIGLGCPLQTLILLAFRLYWGWKLYDTGSGKLQNHEDIVGFFDSLGIPAPSFNAWFVSGLECFGGLLLILGLCSRPVAFMMTINMLVAYLAVEDERVKLLGLFNDPTPFLTADPFFYLLTSF